MSTLEESLISRRSKAEDETTVYFSYDKSDQDFVLPIIASVKAAGHRVWLDQGRTINSTWAELAVLAVSSAAAVVPFLSAERAGSKFGRAELEYARKEGKKILPVFLEGPSALPKDLKEALTAGPGVYETADPEVVSKSILHYLEQLQVPKPDPPSDEKIDFVTRIPNIRKVKPCAVLIVLGALALLGLVILFATLRQPAPQAPVATSPAEAPQPPEAAAPASEAPVPAEEAAPPAAGPPLRVVPAPDEQAAPAEEAAPPAAGPPLRVVPAPDEQAAPAGPAAEEPVATPESSDRPSFDVEISGESFRPGEHFTATVSSVPDDLLGQAVVGIFVKGAAADDFRLYVTIAEPDEVIDLTAPRLPGEYEVRTLVSGKPMTDEGLVDSFDITVAP
ncbi:MAG: toll/interleukin-1 receptor domain-containing protein [Deltaproteobacteria bacterium]|jgi:hypothetical protein|nr:toll/interleukin-1 receptor domain-containing protein [Deltaproteobacteria bacterium]